MSGIFRSIDISASGMSVQRRKMDAVSENIANIDTARTAKGGPYRRQRVMVSEAKGGSFDSQLQASLTNRHGKLARTNSRHMQGMSIGSEVEPRGIMAQGTQIDDPDSSTKLVYDPSHPEANEDGFVEMPDIEIINEMVDMIAANRAYEANISAVSASKRMLDEAMNI